MTLIECPRCHGYPFNERTGRFEGKARKLTMRIDNVMATTETIHFHCGNCCKKMVMTYEEWDKKEKGIVQGQQDLSQISL